MTNHPNRSTAPIRFIAYSVASMNALAAADTAEEAVTRATGAHQISDEFLVVAKVRTQAELHQLDVLPRSAEIVWRGSNDLAQRFRA